MEAVNFDKFLSQTKALTMLLDRIAHNPTQLGIMDIDISNSFNSFAPAQQIGKQAIPIGLESCIERRIG